MKLFSTGTGDNKDWRSSCKVKQGESLTGKKLSDVISYLRAEYLVRHKLTHIWEIDEYWSLDFMQEVQEILGPETNKEFTFRLASPLDFMTDYTSHRRWNQHVLEMVWDSGPPDGWTWETLGKLNVERKVWLVFRGRHYDACSPNGEHSLFDLHTHKVFFARELEKTKAV
jgi:hypothetical protein